MTIGNYSFLDLEIQRSQYIRPKVTVHKGAETIQGRKLFNGGNYMRKHGMQTLQVMYFSGACLVRRWTLLLDDNRKNLIKINSSFHHYLLSIMDWLCPGLCGQG